MDKKVLHQNKYFDVIEIDGMYGIEPSDLCVVVMPFEKDQRGLPKLLGVLKEYNPMREGNYSTTLITGRAEGEDPDVLATAMRELKEESGYDVLEPERWFYLGGMTTSKVVYQEHPCFAVDVTGLIRAPKEGDGTKSEEKSEFHMKPVKEALNNNDSFIPTLFLKMFRYIFNFSDFSKEDEQPLDKVNNLKKKIDITYLNIDGVNGSLVRHDNLGEPYIEYTVREITDDVKEIPPVIDGVNIVVKIAESNL